jgi:hypothetical protein
VVESRLFDQKIRTMMIPTQHPVAAGHLGSAFGWRIDPFTGGSALHTGLDFQSDPGTPIAAAAGGVVVTQEWHPQFGNLVEVDHGNGLLTRYAHASRVSCTGATWSSAGRRSPRSAPPGAPPARTCISRCWWTACPQDPRKFLDAGANIAPGQAPGPGTHRVAGPASPAVKSAALPRPALASARGSPTCCSYTRNWLSREADGLQGGTAFMAKNFLTSIFGSRNDRLLKQYRRVVEQVSALEQQFEKLDDQQLRAKTQEFKDRVAKGESLDDLLPEAFAVVREGSKRVMKMRHFDVQMLGGMALHNGKIAEMRTGEGKTLTATLAVYLNALSGRGVHVVTVNDYLANRDAQWMGRLYNFLGLSVGVNLPQMTRQEKQAAYGSDITYGTNNEFGFDYLRDNMVYEPADRVQRGLNYAIVDEVDSILIDEARTPLIISGQAEDHTDLYMAMNKVVPLLTRQEGEADPLTGQGVTKPGDFTVDEKTHQVFLTEQGHENAERILANLGLLPEGASLYDPANITLMHHLYAALRAKHLYHRDQHYVVQRGEEGQLRS